MGLPYDVDSKPYKLVEVGPAKGKRGPIYAIAAVKEKGLEVWGFRSRVGRVCRSSRWCTCCERVSVAVTTGSTQRGLRVRRSVSHSRGLSGHFQGLGGQGPPCKVPGQSQRFPVSLHVQDLRGDRSRCAEDRLRYSKAGTLSKRDHKLVRPERAQQSDGGLVLYSRVSLRRQR
eukprot:scaffold7382_cov406-Prasinococcus_capsulatus_cf.AAC.15